MNTKKADWIASQLGGDIDADDVYDVLAGYITEPKDFVESVNIAAEEYDRKKFHAF